MKHLTKQDMVTLQRLVMTHEPELRDLAQAIGNEIAEYKTFCVTSFLAGNPIDNTTEMFNTQCTSLIEFAAKYIQENIDASYTSFTVESILESDTEELKWVNFGHKRMIMMDSLKHPRILYFSFSE